MHYVPYLKDGFMGVYISSLHKKFDITGALKKIINHSTYQGQITLRLLFQVIRFRLHIEYSLDHQRPCGYFRQLYNYLNVLELTNENVH